ncbi:MAG TPA: periplasmic heavy metal sensor [Myxococcales bacterium]|nr:periplasmic heavy metal sensor [Myxococcales bacterium]
MKWKRIGLALGLAGVLGAATAALAAANGHRGRNFQAMITNRVNHLLDQVNATDAQRQTINQVKDDVLTKLAAKRQQHANEHAQWMSALTADTVDVNALNAAADAKAQDMASTAKDIIIPALVKVHDTLTPAQRQKLAEMVKSHHQPQGGFGGPEQ